MEVELPSQLRNSSHCRNLTDDAEAGGGGVPTEAFVVKLSEYV